MKAYLILIVLMVTGSQAADRPVCNIGCLLVQGPEYQYGDVTFGQWDPNKCCMELSE